MTTSENKNAWDFWRKFGEHPICLAPMVDLGDLAFRLLVRRHNVQVCWTGMINASQWNSSKKYHKTVVATNDQDIPLICQISGSIDSGLLAAANSVILIPSCCALDINLGCCQRVARRGNYGYYLVDTENKRQNVIKLVTQISQSIDRPLCVKIRMIEDDINLTINFAKELEKAGAEIITVHARSEKQDKSGVMNIQCVKEIVKNLSIPVIANGGIQSKADAYFILQETGAAGIMVGQALLKNPALFDSDESLSIFDVAREYLDIWTEYGGCGIDIIRRHMFYMFEDIISDNNEMKKKISQSANVEEILEIIQQLESQQSQ